MDSTCLDGLPGKKVTRRFCIFDGISILLHVLRTLVHHGLCMVFLAGCSGGEQKPAPGTPLKEPPPSASHRAVPEFNGDRAFSSLVGQTAFGPRNPGSPGHQGCLSYLVGELRSTTSDVRLQEFTLAGYDGEALALTNILASFRPELASRILLCAHWDTRPRAEQDESKGRRHLPIIGANDGASGTAVLLELSRLFHDQPPPVGVDIILFDGEDYGREGDLPRYLLGSRHYARTVDRTRLPEFGVLLDMVGDTFLDLPREANSVKFAPDIVDLVWGTAKRLGVMEFVDESGPEIYDDHVPLNEAGIKTIDIIDFNYPDPTNRFWHTHQDIPANCSPRSLAAVGTVLTHVVYEQKP
jgi:glutaminyl-peptide cyclotransferase